MSAHRPFVVQFRVARQPNAPWLTCMLERTGLPAAFVGRAEAERWMLKRSEARPPGEYDYRVNDEQDEARP